MDNKHEVPKFKFMTNILSSSLARVIRVKQLEKICADGEISFMRLIIIIFAVVGTALTILYLSVKDFYKFTYIWKGMIFLYIALAIIAYQSLASIRGGKSLLSAVLSMEQNRFEEFFRRRFKENNLVLKNLGIDSMKKGILKFTDNYVGVAYLVSGQLNNSVLPSVVIKLLKARESYLVSRKASSNEILITSVRHVDIEPQLESLEELYMKNNEDDLNDMWNRYMISQMADHIKLNFKDKDISIKQVLIIKDIDIKTLMQSKDIFERAVNNEGLYAHAIPLLTKEDLTKYLQSVTLLSEKGVEQFVSKEKDSKSKEIGY